MFTALLQTSISGIGSIYCITIVARQSETLTQANSLGIEGDASLCLET